MLFLGTVTDVEIAIANVIVTLNGNHAKANVMVKHANVMEIVVLKRENVMVKNVNVRKESVKVRNMKENESGMKSVIVIEIVSAKMIGIVK